MRIAIVAGEASGDILGAGLIRLLKQKQPDIEFFGVGGDLMIAEGFKSLVPMDRLSVMGFVEPLKRLPELFRIRRQLLDEVLGEPTDVFIGIDSPDFNLGLEKRLKARGVKTCHYVSPSLWAWRQGRIKGVKKSVDLMLTVLPFEKGIYEENQVPVKFVGHPLAEQIPFEPDQVAAKKSLGIEHAPSVLAVMPGSRQGEVNLMGKLFLDVLADLTEKLPDTLFVIPAASDERMKQLREVLATCSKSLQSRIKLTQGKSQQVMTAADGVLLASGTTALEAMLLKKPMVVTYKLAPLSYAIVSRLIRCEYVSLPNLLANEPLVPEILQDEASVSALSDAVLEVMTNNTKREIQISRFKTLHQSIQKHADEQAAEAVWELIHA